MGDRNTLILNLKQFKVMYPQYSEEIILKAIENYIYRESKNSNYKYLQKAHYTVFKNNQSRLAALCEDLVINSDTVSESTFYHDL